jgi:hypothetical protein
LNKTIPSQVSVPESELVPVPGMKDFHLIGPLLAGPHRLLELLHITAGHPLHGRFCVQIQASIYAQLLPLQGMDYHP